MTYPTRNTGSDLLPFDRRVTYPRARLKAMRDAEARRERERPREDFDADRLRRDLADRPLDVRLNDGDGDAATREYLRRMGWTDERLRRAMVILRENLQSQIHPAVATPPTLERPDLAGFHIAAARAAGYDPVELWPSLRGVLAPTNDALVASGSGMTTAEYNRWERDRAAERDLASRWRRLNDLLFGGALPMPDFKVAYTNELLATARGHGRRRLDFAAWYTAGDRPGRGTITVRAHEVADDGFLVHEMVHQWQHHRGLPVDHGDEFIRRANLVAQASELPFVQNPRMWPHDQALAASGAPVTTCGVGPVGNAGPDRPFRGPQGRREHRSRSVPATSPSRPIRSSTGRAGASCRHRSDGRCACAEARR